ncbi:MAG: protein-L-isoaspartate O-methyltransferase [Paracoccaceae bacterium]
MSEFSTRRVMMVDTQVRPSDVTKFPIIAAMLVVPREIYLPAAMREVAYVGLNIDIADRRVVLEARSLAKMLDILDIQPGERVLDLGCGFGYSSAVIAEIGGEVVGVEEDTAMAADARATLSGKATVIIGPIVAGAITQGPYDVMILQGAVETVPDALLTQLKEGGRIAAIFMSGALGTAKVGYKLDGEVSWRPIFNATAPILPGFEAKRGFVL